MEEFCCADFEKATELGTDSEGWSSAIWKTKEGWEVGCGSKPLAYCPWCGKPLDYDRRSEDEIAKEFHEKFGSKEFKHKLNSKEHQEKLRLLLDEFNRLSH